MYNGYSTELDVTGQMDFMHYTDDPVDLAVDLVNTYGWVSGSDVLQDVADLERFVAESGEWAPDLPPARAEDVEAARRLRTALRDVFEAADGDEASRLINEILRTGGAVPRLSTHGDTPHLHFDAADGSLGSWLSVVTAMGLATVIADHGFERLGVCQADDCDDAYVDTSRNRSRRHCSTTCRTRSNVAAHRRRKQEG